VVRRGGHDFAARRHPLARIALGEQDLRRAAQAALMMSERESPGANEWSRLVALANGSVRRLLVLWMRDGLKMQERIDTVFAGLPRLDWGLVHTVGDELGSAAAADKLETFYELLLGHIAGLVRQAASGGSAGSRAVALPRLASWAELWETIVRDKAETLALNLDRRMLILDTLARVARAAESA
jgi:DNA polymerase-3 subunit delta'